MFKHYLLVGFRMLVRYKKQTFFIVCGLAVGFVCFALSALWIHYEMSYDSFHSKSDRIYRLLYGRFDILPGMLSEYMKATFPEVENASCVTSGLRFFEEGVDAGSNYIRVDSAFFDMFDVEILSGQVKALFDGENSVLLTDDFIERRGVKGASSVRLFAGSSNEKQYHIRASVKSWGEHTTIPFDFIFPGNQKSWERQEGHIYLLLREGTDVEAFKKKIKQLDLTEQSYWLGSMQETFEIFDLDKLHYHPLIGDRGKLKFNQIVLFAIASIFVILSLLFNYLSLFVSRIQLKRRDLALRVVNGASNKELFLQLSVEFILVMLLAILVGMLLIEWLMPHFMAFAQIRETARSIYGELLWYVGALFCFSWLLSLYPIYFFKKDTLQESLQQSNVRARNLFRRGALFFQFVVGIIFLFCTFVFVKQINFLQRVDLGFDRTRGMGVYQIGYPAYDFKEDFPQIEKIPEVESLTGSYHGLLMPQQFLSTSVRAVHDNGELGEEIDMSRAGVTPDYFDFFKIKCLEGELFDKTDEEKNRDKVVINQSLAKKLGYEHPVGSIVKDWIDKEYTIIGVVNDLYGDSPVEPPTPILYKITDRYADFSFRYAPGKRGEAEKKVSEILSSKLGKTFDIKDMEETYRSYTEQDRIFLKLLYLLSFICLLSSFFGIYSMVSLACEQRRKEIAIRKVNGAGMGSLLSLFLKEYYLLLAVASLVAFPVGYLFIKPWIEHFVLQTPVSWWIFAGIFFCVAVLMTLIIVVRIWRTIHINPASELKKE